LTTGSTAREDGPPWSPFATVARHVVINMRRDLDAAGGCIVIDVKLNDDAERAVKAAEAKQATAHGSKTSAALAAKRYRARKRGEPVPKRKPGPKPKPAYELLTENRRLRHRIEELELMQSLASKQIDRRARNLTVERVAGELLDVLRRGDVVTDSPAERVLLGDVTAAIEARHEYWPD
jgi:hypothetical protein